MKKQAIRLYCTDTGATRPFLLFACLSFAALTHAQIRKPAADENRMIITVSNNGLSIAVKGKEVTVSGNPALDSCLQKIIPGLNHPTIWLDIPSDMDQDKRRSIAAFLEKFHCPVMSFLKSEPVSPPVATRRLDTVSP